MKQNLRILIKFIGTKISVVSVAMLLLGVVVGGFLPLYYNSSRDAYISTYMVIFSYGENGVNYVDSHLILLVPFLFSLLAIPADIYGFFLFDFKKDHDKAGKMFLISSVSSLFAGVFYMFAYMIANAAYDLMFGYFFVGIPMIISGLCSLPCAILPLLEDDVKKVE